MNGTPTEPAGGLTRDGHLHLVEALAVEAGNAILAAREHGVESSSKADGSPVTEADLAADTIILEGLRNLAPAIPAITEETYTGQDAEEPQVYWCVDPLDGTKGFINGGRDFTVNIALIENRAPVLGVIYAPARGELWAGMGGSASKRQAEPGGDHSLETLGVPVAIEARAARTDYPDIVATRAHRSPELESWIERLGAGEDIAVGSSLKFCILAEGLADLYPRASTTMEWDTAAGQAILEAAGGGVYAPGGKPFGYGKPGRRNGYFAGMARLAGNPPPDWLPPKDEDSGDGSDA